MLPRVGGTIRPSRWKKGSTGGSPPRLSCFPCQSTPRWRHDPASALEERQNRGEPPPVLVLQLSRNPHSIDPEPIRNRSRPSPDLLRGRLPRLTGRRGLARPGPPRPEGHDPEERQLFAAQPQVALDDGADQPGQVHQPAELLVDQGGGGPLLGLQRPPVRAQGFEPAER